MSTTTTTEASWPTPAAMERARDALDRLPARIDGRRLPRPNAEHNACVCCGAVRSTGWRRVGRMPDRGTERGQRYYACDACSFGGAR